MVLICWEFRVENESVKSICMNLDIGKDMKDQRTC